MPYRLLLAIVLALGVTLAWTPAQVEASADPVVDVGECEEATVVAVALTRPDTRTEIEHDVVTPRTLDASPPPVPPPER